MKKLSKSILLVALLVGMTIPAEAQTSTQGKEFWVSLIPSESPENKNKPLDKNDGEYYFGAYLAISAPKACTVKVSNPNTGWSKIATVGNNSWTELKTEMTAGDGGFIPLGEWFGSAQPASEQALNLGLKVEATENISVYSSLRWQMSMDASNILPVTALQSEYIVQTYDANGNARNFNGVKRNVFSILAAEDCVVDVTLAAQTAGGKTGTISNISLRAGQVYHVLSAENVSLSGSRVVARNGKKIAVFAGCPCTRVPNHYSDRDLLYEQLFPIDYWGQNFIVTRSKEKDANRVMVTAQEKNTEVIIYGRYDPSAVRAEDHTLKTNDTVTLMAGKSYEFEMSVGHTDNATWQSSSTRDGFTTLHSFVDSAVYIKTSCPCAVLSYDVGNGYYRNDAGKETYEKNGEEYGAPAMTWVSPVEQMISDIVFGVMGTKKTTRHFLNVIVETRDVPTTTLNGKSLSSYFKPVESNNAYSYARIKLFETVPGQSNPFYHLKSKYGFIATVYGNGDDESYAYSVGSSAVKRAISVDGYKFTKGMTVDDVKQTYCVNAPLLFNPQIGTDIIDSVKWDFGDGTSAKSIITEGIEIEHTYFSPGWYDIVANVYAHKECPFSSYPADEVSFSFYVNRPDTIIRPDTVCVEPDDTRENYLDTVTYDCDSVVITQNLVLHKSYHTFDTVFNDRGYLNGQLYTESQDNITWTLKNHEQCDSIITCEHLIVRKCLNLQVANDSADQHTCAGKTLDIPYSYVKDGKAGTARLIRMDNQQEYEVQMIDDVVLNGRMTGEFTLDTKTWEPGLYTAKIKVADEYCGGEAESPLLNIAIYYPQEIFTFRFNNVLAVYKKGFGENNYDFKGYQWYKNGMPIDGAIESVYHTEEVFVPDDTYYVELTDYKNFTLQSCSFTVPKVIPDYNPEPDKAPAQKKLKNNQMVIEHDGHTYDIYGQRIE